MKHSPACRDIGTCRVALLCCAVAACVAGCAHEAEPNVRTDLAPDERPPPAAPLAESTPGRAIAEADVGLMLSEAGMTCRSNAVTVDQAPDPGMTRAFNCGDVNVVVFDSEHNATTAWERYQSQAAPDGGFVQSGNVLLIIRQYNAKAWEFYDQLKS